MATKTSKLQILPPVSEPSPAAKRARSAEPVPVRRQVAQAFKSRNIVPTIIGVAFSGFVPWAVYKIAHGDVGYTKIAQLIPHFELLSPLLVVGGLLYSALTVYEWAKRVVLSPAKATGFVILLEGILAFIDAPSLTFPALALLVGINGLAAGCNVSRE